MRITKAKILAIMERYGIDEAAAEHEAEQDAIANWKCPECGAVLEAVNTEGLDGDELKALEDAKSCTQCCRMYWLD